MVARRTSPLRLLQIIIITSLNIPACFTARINPVLAASGMPDSSQFGFGAVIDPWGFDTELSMNIADGIGLDWIAIEFNWAHTAPTQQAVPSFHELDRTFALAQHYGLNVLLSISNPPGWAMTPDGPDPSLVNSLVNELADRYKGSLLALELFPYANTRSGWGTRPDPAAYTAMLQRIDAALSSRQTNVILISGGLVFAGSQDTSSSMEDLAYLKGLYEAGAAQFMPIVSLRLDNLVGDALDSPGHGEQRVLRHYEVVRQVMLEHGHANGILWVTGYTWPANSAQYSAVEDVKWLSQALNLMKSQLYIGAAFYNRINSSSGENITITGEPLVADDGQDVLLHLALSKIAETIAFSRGEKPPALQFQLAKRLVSGIQKRTIMTKIP